MIRLWLFVVFAFLLLVAAWSSLIFIATKFSPEQITVSQEKSR
jgi:cell division septal protein FtsQ